MLSSGFIRGGYRFGLESHMKSPIAPKSPVGTIKSASAGRVFSATGPRIPNVKTNAQPRGLTALKG